MRKRKMLIICMAVVMIFTACEPMSTKEEKINGDELAKIEKKRNWQTFNDESFG